MDICKCMIYNTMESCIDGGCNWCSDNNICGRSLDCNSITYGLVSNNFTNPFNNGTREFCLLNNKHCNYLYGDLKYNESVCVYNLLYSSNIVILLPMLIIFLIFSIKLKNNLKAKLANLARTDRYVELSYQRRILIHKVELYLSYALIFFHILMLFILFINLLSYYNSPIIYEITDAILMVYLLIIFSIVILLLFTLVIFTLIGIGIGLSYTCCVNLFYYLENYCYKSFIVTTIKKYIIIISHKISNLCNKTPVLNSNDIDNDQIIGNDNL